MALGMFNLERTDLGIFLFFVPAQPAISEADDADDDENDADDSSWFHDVDVTTVAVRQSIG